MMYIPVHLAAAEKGLLEAKEKIRSKVASKVGVVGQNLVQRLLRIKMRRPKNGQRQSAMF
jgi:hypothetical protein